MSKGGDVLLAVQARLQKITLANGFPIGVKDVIIAKGQLTLNLPEAKCPLIEIIQGPENYDHQGAGQVEVSSAFILRLVNKKSSTDLDMETFKACVIRAIMGDSYTASGNSNLNFGGKIAAPKLVRCDSDYNMVDANRIYAILFETVRMCQPYAF
jgi:hypothetical protein